MEEQQQKPKKKKLILKILGGLFLVYLIIFTIQFAYAQARTKRYDDFWSGYYSSEWAAEDAKPTIWTTDGDTFRDYSDKRNDSRYHKAYIVDNLENFNYGLDKEDLGTYNVNYMAVYNTLKGTESIIGMKYKGNTIIIYVRKHLIHFGEQEPCHYVIEVSNKIKKVEVRYR